MRQLLRIAMFSIALSLGLLLAGQLAEAGIERELCQHCRRFSDVSPARTELHITRNDKPRGLAGCSLYCALRLRLAYPTAELNRIMITDYDTIGNDYPNKLRVEKAWILYGAKGDVEDSHPPVCYGFRDKEDAEASQVELGGELLEWETVSERLTAIAEKDIAAEKEEEEQDDSPYGRPLRPRR